MILPSQPSPASTGDRSDQRVYLHRVDWDTFESILVARGDDSGVRITYLDGELELMTPSIDHESLRKRLAQLLEAYAEETGIELEGFGSWTLLEKAKRLGVEADECYIIGPIDQPPRVPDIAIEVVWTSGGLDKLAVYRGLGVPEVWIWQDGGLRFFVLEHDRYLAATRSRIIPALDPALIIRCMGEHSQTRALRRLRAEISSLPHPDRGAP